MPIKPSTKSLYRPEIDGLRAFAVVAVIINHFNKDLLPNGYLGVDIFFVISGYVITSSIYQRSNENFKEFFTGFYERRIKRIIPSLSIFIILTSILLCLFNPWPVPSLRTGIASIFGLSNLYLLKQSTDYFASSTELNTFTHTWSLGVEEQFYFLYPFIFWFSGFGRNSKKSFRNLIIIISLISTISYLGFLYLYEINQPAAYFLMPTRFWEMGAGCLLFSCLKKSKAFKNSLEKIPPFTLIFLIILIMYRQIFWEPVSTLFVVILTSLLIGTLNRKSLLFQIFTHPRVLYIGLLSYPLYLWHWGILSISRWSIGIHWWSVPFQIFLIIFLAKASYRWIETPIKNKVFFDNRLKNFAFGSGVIITISSFLVSLERPLDKKLYTGNYEYENLVNFARLYDNTTNAFSSKNCSFLDKLFDLEKAIEFCTLSSKQSNKTFYFVGNSHTDHIRETMYLLNKNEKVNLFSATISSCVFPNHVSRFCKTAQNQIEDWVLKKLKKGDVVFISNRHISNSDKKKEHLKNYNKWITDLKRINKINAFNKIVTDKGGKLVLITPLPEFDVPIENCKPHWFRPIENKKCKKSIKDVRLEREEVYSIINNKIDKNVLKYDPLSAMCFKEICSMTDIYNKPLYIDNHHITDYANRVYIYPHIKLFLKNKNLI